MKKYLVLSRKNWPVGGSPINGKGNHVNTLDLLGVKFPINVYRLIQEKGGEKWIDNPIYEKTKELQEGSVVFLELSESGTEILKLELPSKEDRGIFSLVKRRGEIKTIENLGNNVFNQSFKLNLKGVEREIYVPRYLFNEKGEYYTNPAYHQAKYLGEGDWIRFKAPLIIAGKGILVKVEIFR